MSNRRKGLVLSVVLFLVALAAVAMPAHTVSAQSDQCPYYAMTLTGSVGSTTITTIKGFLVYDKHLKNSHAFDFALVSGNPIEDHYYGNVVFVTDSDMVYGNSDGIESTSLDSETDSIGDYWDATTYTLAGLLDYSYFADDGGPYYVRSGDVAIRFSSDDLNIAISADLIGKNSDGYTSEYKITGKGYLLENETDCAVSND